MIFWLFTKEEICFVFFKTSLPTFSCNLPSGYLTMKKIASLLFIQIPLFLFSQKDAESINWSEEKKLVWEDFKAAPQKNGDVAALTATHLGFAYNVANGKITYDIECRFEKNRSWGLVKNDWILKHEQGHFDVAEIFARKLFKAV